MYVQNLIKRYPIISDQVDSKELQVILTSLEKVLQKNIEGDVVEFGCYKGTTSLFIRRMLNIYARIKEFHVYDSFEGLPSKVSEDLSPAGEQFVEGALKTSKSEFIKNFRQANLKLPIIHKGWFSELRAVDIPDKVAFAFLDGDYYESISDSLSLIEHRLPAGATIIVDDYQSEALPGAKKAVDKWLTRHPYECRVVQSLAILSIS